MECRVKIGRLSLKQPSVGLLGTLVYKGYTQFLRPLVLGPFLFFIFNFVVFPSTIKVEGAVVDSLPPANIISFSECF